MKASLTLDAAGRIVLPAKVRKLLDIKEGSRLILSLDGQVVTLTPMRETIRRAQAILAPYRPRDGRLLSDELVAERREEARREQATAQGIAVDRSTPGRGPRIQEKRRAKRGA